MRFLLGGYTADMEGSASGIGMLRAGAVDDTSAGGPLAFTGSVVPADSPSWLTSHPTLDVVYATLEKRGAVRSAARAGRPSPRSAARSTPVTRPATSPSLRTAHPSSPRAGATETSCA